MPFSRWILLDTVGAVLWNLTFGLLGYFAGVYGTRIEDIFEAHRLIEGVFLALFLGWVVILVLATRRLMRQMREVNSSGSPQKAKDR